MSRCAEEDQTHHYRGRWFGFGPVGHSEEVVFAVFERTKKDGAKLTANSFENAHLAAQNQSVARRLSPRHSTFVTKVVDRGRAQKGELIGVAVANVVDIRHLIAEFETPRGSESVPALCVLDKVERGD